MTLDDPTTAAFANRDPTAFVRQGEEGTLAIDEIQREPALLRTIKAEVDHDRRPGRFLLTGSARVFSLPQVTESLAGRIETVALWPLNQTEREGMLSPTFIDRLFDGKSPQRSQAERALDCSIVWQQGLSRSDGAGRQATTRMVHVLHQRVVTARRPRSGSDRGDPRLPNLLRLLATRSGSLLDVAGLAGDAQLTRTTTSRYLTLLEQLYLVQLIPAWTSSLRTRLVKSPKVTLADSGLALAYSGIDTDRLGTSPELAEGMSMPLSRTS